MRTIRRVHPLPLTLGILLLAMSGILLVFSNAVPNTLGVTLLFLAILIIATSSLFINWMIIFTAASCNGLALTVESITLRPEYLALPLLFLLLVQTRRMGRGVVGSRGSALLAVSAIGFVVWSAVVSSTAPDPGASYFIVMQYAAGFLSLWTLFRCNLPRVRLVALGTLVLAVIALLSLSGHVLAWLGSTDTPGVSASGRTVGFAFEPNIYASQAVVWLGVVYYHRRALPTWTKIAIVPIASTVLTAGTRAAWIALALMAIFAVLRWAQKRPAVIIVVVLLGCIGATFMPAVVSSLASQGVLSPEVTYRLDNLLELDSGTGGYRIANYEVAYEDLSQQERWVTGFGANTFSQYHPIDSTGVGAAYLGSLWVTLFYDSGIVGFVLFGAALLAVAVGSVRRLEAVPIYVAIVICAASTNFMWFQFVWLYLAMLLPSMKVITRVDRTRSLYNNAAEKRSLKN